MPICAHIVTNLLAIFQVSITHLCTVNLLDINMASIDLHYKVRTGNTQEVASILNSYTDNSAKLSKVRSQDSDGLTALHVAAQQKDSTIASTIFDVLDIGINEIFHLLRQTNHDGQTAIETGAQRGHADTISVFLRQLDPCQITNLLSQKNNENCTALMVMASHNSNPDTFHALTNTLSISQRMELLSMTDHNGDTPLHHAAKAGTENKSLIAAMLDSIDLEDRERLLKQMNYENNIVPMLAVFRDHHATDTVVMLLESVRSPHRRLSLCSDPNCFD